MKLVRRLAGSPGDSTVRYSLRVLDGERTISFLPRGAGTVSIQRLELAGPRTLGARAAVPAPSAASPDVEPWRQEMKRAWPLPAWLYSAAWLPLFPAAPRS